MRRNVNRNPFENWASIGFRWISMEICYTNLYWRHKRNGCKDNACCKYKQQKEILNVYCVSIRRRKKNKKDFSEKLTHTTTKVLLYELLKILFRRKFYFPSSDFGYNWQSVRLVDVWYLIWTFNLYFCMTKKSGKWMQNTCMLRRLCVPNDKIHEKKIFFSVKQSHVLFC